MVTLPKSGLCLSCWWIVLVGLFTGFLSGFLGVGGGFIRVPALLYILGLPMKLAVGTDLFEIVISSSYGGWTYAMKGAVEIHAAIIMLVGAAVGAQIGCVATRYVHGIGLRFYFALCIFGSGFGVVAKQISTHYRGLYWDRLKEVLVAQGVTGADLMKKLREPAYIKSMLASHPDWQPWAHTEKIWNNIAGVLSLGLAVGLSLVIIFLCVRGIMRERKTGQISGA